MLTGKYDSVFTATKKHWVPHWDLKINPVGWNINNRPRRQEEMNIMKKMECFIFKKTAFKVNLDTAVE